MLRACRTVARTAIASSSTASLHTSAVARAVSSQATAASAARSHKEDRAAARRLRAANAPHVVLGTRPGDEAAWANSDLARILVTEASLRDAPAGVPGYGVAPGTPDARLLLGALPALTAEAVCLNASAVKGAGDAVEPAQMVRQLGIEGEKAEQLRRLLDLRNADAAGLMFENRRRCVEEFSAPGKPHDSGRVEVQAAILTMRIRNMWDHLTTHKKDLANRLSLRKMVHQRAKILKYLKRTSRARYDALLPRLALDPAAVEGELIL